MAQSDFFTASCCGPRLFRVFHPIFVGYNASPRQRGAVDRFNYTPLLYAATIDYGDPETATVLIQAGANPNAKDTNGKTPLSQARDLPYFRAELEKAGAK